jgi:hypothetical protein
VWWTGAADLAGAGTGAAQEAGIPPAVRGMGETRTMQKPEFRDQKSELTGGKGLGTGRRGEVRSQRPEGRNADGESNHGSTQINTDGKLDGVFPLGHQATKRFWIPSPEP